MKELLIKVKELFDWNRKDLIVPEHIALTIGGSEAWAKKNNKTLGEAYQESFFTVYKIILEQLKLEIKTLSILISTTAMKGDTAFNSALAKFLNELKKDKKIEENNVKICVLGKWYETPPEVVEPIKNLMENTQQPGNLYLNLGINYNGKQEIIDACKIIARKIESEKLDPLTIDDETLKQNLYSSNLAPVQLIVQNGADRQRGSFLLWQSADAMLYQTEKLWPDYTENDLLKAIVEYNKAKEE